MSKNVFVENEEVTWDSRTGDYKWALRATFIKYVGKKSAQIKCGEKTKTVRLTSLRKQ